MSWQDLLYDLRNVLAELYSDEESAKRVASDAGLPVVFIDWEGAPTDYWSKVVRQAELRWALRRLIDIALDEYTEGPFHDELRRIREGIARYRGAPLNPMFPGGDPGKSDSERLLAVEVKVELLMWAVAGLYLAIFGLGMLILQRT